MYVLPGINVAQSKLNFMTWLDTVVLSLSRDPLLYQSNGTREWGIFHQLKADEFVIVTSTLFTNMGARLHHKDDNMRKVVLHDGSRPGKINSMSTTLGPLCLSLNY